jgi:hypothetical protein
VSIIARVIDWLFPPRSYMTLYRRVLRCEDNGHPPMLGLFAVWHRSRTPPRIDLPGEWVMVLTQAMRHRRWHP